MNTIPDIAKSDLPLKEGKERTTGYNLHTAISYNESTYRVF